MTGLSAAPNLTKLATNMLEPIDSKHSTGGAHVHL